KNHDRSSGRPIPITLSQLSGAGTKRWNQSTRRETMKLILRALLATAAFVASPAEACERWTEAQANDWYAKQCWMVG
ncbi:hypothetical protein ACVWZA_004375, partial [Sphingomonas sp. UYAg733]